VTVVDQNTIANDANLQSNVKSGGTTRLVTYVTFFGQTTGGNTIQSDEFEFPVDVCDGCLITFPAADDNPLPSLPQPNCLLAASNSSSSSVPTPCFPGQDFAVECAVCQGIEACHGAVPSGFVEDAGTD
jgi:hypothetical protein